jgi:hypothetical protein
MFFLALPPRQFQVEVQAAACHGFFALRLSFWAPLHQRRYPVAFSSAANFSTGCFHRIAITVFTGPILMIGMA